jgi:signal transduction histidine kinase/CheY-like chemotaxis protein
MGFFSFFTKQTPESSDQNRELTLNNFDELFSKELLNAIVDNSSSRMLFFTKKDGWVGANKIFFDTFNLHGIAEFRSRFDSVRDIFLAESEEIFTESDSSWLDYIKKYKTDGYNVTLVDSNKEVLHIRIKCKSINQNFYILELEDITQLYTAQQKTKEVEKLKSKFLANIGHEFRTPMNGILGFLELLGESNLDKKQSEYIQLIAKSSKNLMGNIETLLDLSQMQGGRLKLETSSFDITKEMETLIYNYFVLGKDKGIKVLTFIDPKLPKELSSDIRKIKQVISSLIQNAIKFTPRGGKVIVEVKLLKRQMNGECSIGFMIKDNGNGISSEQLALISEPFNAGTQADERLGVGLSLSHGLVNLLGSELRVKSEESFGSIFNFVLNFATSSGQSYKMMPKRKVKVLLLNPRKIDEANFLTTYLRSFAVDVIKSNILDENIYDNISTLYIVADQNDSSWMLKLGTYTKRVPVIMLLEDGEKLQTKLTYIVDDVIKKPLFPSVISNHLKRVHGLELSNKKEEKLELHGLLTALIAEDNMINMRLVQVLLQDYNIVVSNASNGNVAVEMANKNKYDIIFMDIDMPEKNGIEATQEIKSTMNINSKTPIVALTAMAMEGDREMLMNEGLDDYLAKPLSRDNLEVILNKYLKVAAV